MLSIMTEAKLRFTIGRTSKTLSPLIQRSNCMCAVFQHPSLLRGRGGTIYRRVSAQKQITAHCRSHIHIPALLINVHNYYCALCENIRVHRNFDLAMKCTKKGAKKVKQTRLLCSIICACLAHEAVLW